MKKSVILLLLLSVLNSFAQDYKFGVVSKEALEEKFYTQDSTANAVFLLKERKMYYEFYNNQGFKIVTNVRVRIKFYNQKGLEDATRKVYLYKNAGINEKVNSIKGYTFNLENGNIQKEKLRSKNIFTEELSENRGLKKIVFPNVKAGSIIDLKYRVVSPYTTSIDDVEFQFNIPVKEYLTTITIPEYFIFKENYKGFYAINAKKEAKNSSFTLTSKSRNSGFGSSFSNSKIDYRDTKTIFKAKNIPALKDDEPFVGSIENYRGGVKYELSYVKYPNSRPKYYTTTWEDVSKKIHQFKNFGGELNKTGYFKNDLKALLENKKSEIEKVAAIFQFVKSKVKWNGVYGKYTQKGVKKAYKEGVGNIADINIMLTAMLREAGLNANPVLVSSKNNGIPIFPTLNGFNYVISRVVLSNDKYVVLDASEPYSIPNLLPVRALNWKGRVVTKKGGSSWVNVKPIEYATEDHKLFAKIAEDFSIEGSLRSTFGNLNAMNYRKKNNATSKEQLISNLEEKYDIEIGEFKLTNKEKIGLPITRTVKFLSEDAIEEIGGKLYVQPMLFLTNLSSPFKRDERKFPVDFIAKWKDKHTASIALPKGYKVEKIPEPVSIALPENLGVFKYQVKQNQGKIMLISLLQFNQSLIPSSYYPSLKMFYDKVVAKQSEKVVLTKIN